MQKPLDKALSVLASGGIVAHATDTCYGFACDIFNKNAIDRLYKIKKMDVKKPVSIIVSDLTMAKYFGVFNKKALELAKKHWPGALTIIVRRKKTLPLFLNPTAKTIGFRVPRHKLSIELVKKLKKPITTTSANISGKPSPYSVSAIKKPDFIIDAGKLPKNAPSTIVDCSKKDLKILRQGSLKI